MQRSGYFSYSTSTVTLKFRDKLYCEVPGFLKYHAVSTGLSKTVKSIETSQLLTEVSMDFRAFEAPVVPNGVI